MLLLQTTTQAPVQTVPVATGPSFTQTLIGSFRDAFSMILSAIPRILGFIIIVAIGWFVSSILARGVIGLLRAIRFDELMQRSGLADFMNKMGTGLDSAGEEEGEDGRVTTATTCQALPAKPSAVSGQRAAGSSVRSGSRELDN